MLIYFDTSYIIFYRYHALLNWYKLAKPEQEINEALVCSAEFTNKFKDLFIKMINSIIEKYQKDNPVLKIYFARDCSRKDIWRMGMASSYKEGRANNNYVSYAFKNALNIINELCLRYDNYLVLYCENCEADDIIAVSTKHFVDEKIVIYTSDHDYLQLIKPNIDIFDLKGRSLKDKSVGDPAKDLLIKILMGDKSDNIPAIKPRLGRKTAQGLTENPDKLELLLKDDTIKQKYEHNKKMIDFDMIPTELKENILKLYSNL